MGLRVAPYQHHRSIINYQTQLRSALHQACPQWHSTSGFPFFCCHRGQVNRTLTIRTSHQNATRDPRKVKCTTMKYFTQFLTGKILVQNGMIWKSLNCLRNLTCSHQLAIWLWCSSSKRNLVYSFILFWGTICNKPQSLLFLKSNF